MNEVAARVLKMTRRRVMMTLPCQLISGSNLIRRNRSTGRDLRTRWGVLVGAVDSSIEKG